LTDPSKFRECLNGKSEAFPQCKKYFSCIKLIKIQYQQVSKNQQVVVIQISPSRVSTRSILEHGIFMAQRLRNSVGKSGEAVMN
jgi:hypothetical protein